MLAFLEKKPPRVLTFYASIDRLLPPTTSSTTGGGTQCSFSVDPSV